MAHPHLNGRFSRYPCRCRDCGARRTLRRHPDTYKPRRCPCGGTKGWRVDWFRLTREFKQRTCGCDGYPFPHDQRTSRWCIHHPEGPTNEMICDRYGPDALQA